MVTASAAVIAVTAATTTELLRPIVAELVKRASIDARFFSAPTSLRPCV